LSQAAPRPFLVELLRLLCLDSMFLVASSLEMRDDDLEALGRRRAERYELVAQGGSGDDEPQPAWELALCAATAPIRPPIWLPMHQLVGDVSLAAGARGVRSLFTRKPSGSQVARARAVGSFAVRALAAVLGADGPLDPDERHVRACLVAALGLPEQDSVVLCAEPPMPVESIEVPPDLDPKLARSLVRGTWHAALADGVDPREDAAVLGLGGRLGLQDAEIEGQRREAEEALGAGRALGAAAVDAVRYVLADSPRSPRLGRLVAGLLVPPSHRSEALAAIEHGAAAILARRHALGRDSRVACLALGWYAALSTDPSEARGAELAVRHDRVASDLGGKSEGAVTREAVRALVRAGLEAAAVRAGL
jgi:hypothetical protein